MVETENLSEVLGNLVEARMVMKHIKGILMKSGDESAVSDIDNMLFQQKRHINILCGNLNASVDDTKGNIDSLKEKLKGNQNYKLIKEKIEKLETLLKN